MKAAQPFMLIVVQIGNTKRATEGCAFKLSSADANVTGNVAAEDFVNNGDNSSSAKLYFYQILKDR